MKDICAMQNKGLGHILLRKSASAWAWGPCGCKEPQLPGEEVKRFFHLFLTDSDFLITLVLLVCDLSYFVSVHPLKGSVH